MTYTYDEALKTSQEYFGDDDLAPKVFLDKYALRDTSGELLEDSPLKMHHRLAREFARIEKKYPNPMSEEEIFETFDRFKYIVPQGSPMSAIGNPHKMQSLSNCFVIGAPLDSYGGIMYTDQEMAQLMKRRGGVGTDLTPIRPQGMPTANAAQTTDGIGVFMDRYSNTCREVAQGGRRGALMLTISVHHPEIRTFIKIKKDRSRVTGANISIRITDEFMNAVNADEQVQLRWPVSSEFPNEVEENVDARELWNEIIEAAHADAEPGVLFWDTAIRRTPADIYAEFGFRSTSTNPCGEILLCPDDSCRLLLLNVVSFITNPFTPEARFNTKLFRQMVRKAQRLMDDLVDLEIEAIDRIIKKIKKDPEPARVKAIELDMWKRMKLKAEEGRRTGLGVTGIGDSVAALGLRYGSPESIKEVEKIYKLLALGAYESSCEMAEERGKFTHYDFAKEEGHPFIEQLFKANSNLRTMHKEHGRRNISLTTTAPCGSVSILTQTTSGIEPVFLTNYKRRKKINPADENARMDFKDQMGDWWQEFEVYHKGVKDWMNITGKTDISKSPYYKAIANEVSWRGAVELQAAAQKWVCHAISKTINMPNDVSVEEVAKAYMHGWQTGCKGLTVYRDGCRSGVLVSSDDEKSVESGRPNNIVHSQAPKRPEGLPCEIHHATINKKRWTILVGMLEDQPYEIFTGYSEDLEIPNKCKFGKIVKIKPGYYNLHVDIGGEEFIIKNMSAKFVNPDSAWATRIVSAALRHGTPVDFLVEQLQKDGDMSDINKVVARLLKKFIREGQQVRSSVTCPACESTKLAYVEGCVTCTGCGWSRC